MTAPWAGSLGGRDSRRYGAPVSPLTPFYVCGAALAIWAVLVSLMGITRPTFPGSKGTERVVVAVSAVLVVAVLLSGVLGAIAEDGETETAAAAPGLRS